MRTKTRTSLLVSMLLMAGAPPAIAQEGPPPAAQDVTESSLLAGGIALRKQGRDAEALAMFEQAYALRPSSRAIAQMALAHQALAQWIEAERGLAMALSDSDDPWIARYRAHLEGSLTAVQEHLAWLQVDSNVVGADVWVEGRPRGRVPLDRTRVVAGEVSVEVRAPSYPPIQRQLLAEAKSMVRADFTFTPPATVESPAVEGRSAAERAKDPPPPPPKRTAGWVALGAAGGLFLTGVAAQVTREWEAQIYNDDSKCGPSGSLSRYARCGTNRDIGSAAQSVAIVAYVGGGIAAVASGLLLFPTWRRGRASAATRFDCQMAGAGVVCGRAF
jgi:PEGA domain-containing protein